MHGQKNLTLQNAKFLQNEDLTPLFLAVIEATEEAIINSLFAAETMQGKDGRVIEKLPTAKVLKWISKAKE
jgi:D-aminopeptidase